MGLKLLWDGVEWTGIDLRLGLKHRGPAARDGLSVEVVMEMAGVPVCTLHCCIESLEICLSKICGEAVEDVTSLSRRLEDCARDLDAESKWVHCLLVWSPEAPDYLTLQY